MWHWALGERESQGLQDLQPLRVLNQNLSFVDDDTTSLIDLLVSMLKDARCAWYVNVTLPDFESFFNVLS